MFQSQEIQKKNKSQKSLIEGNADLQSTAIGKNFMSA